MKYKQNLHTHSIFCDGKNTPQELIEKALELGFDSLGFSGHSAMYYSDTYQFDRADEYIKEIYRLKKEYQGKIDIYCGLEVDMYSKVDLSPFEYLIGAVHYLKMGEQFVGFDRKADVVKNIIDQHFGGDGLKFAKEYYSQLSTLSQYGKFDIVGHFDIITKNIEICKFFDVESKEYKNYALDALHTLIEKFDIFEVNTGAISRKYRTTPYPQDFILKEIKAIGGKITFSSDCHNMDYLDGGFNQAVELAKDCGFKDYVVLKDGKFVEVEL